MKHETFKVECIKLARHPSQFTDNFYANFPEKRRKLATT